MNSSLKKMLKNFIEQSIETSTYVNKLMSNVTLIATESKKIADIIFLLNKRIDDHEILILKLLEHQHSASKNSVDVNILKTKEKSSKPN